MSKLSIIQNHWYTKVYRRDLKIRDNQFCEGKDSPLENYLHSKGIDYDFTSNYDLYKLTDSDELRWLNGSKIFLCALDTYIIVNRVPPEMMIILNELRSEHSGFVLSIRPDFRICGDGIKDRTILTEDLIQGRYFKEKLCGTFPGVTSLYDKCNYDNKLIIIHNTFTEKSPDEITFEELIEDWVNYDNYIMTQMIHLQFNSRENCDYITHIDHEYIFYTIEEYEEKMNNHKLYGSGRKRVKTFKIDNAEIPYSNNPKDNYLYRILQCYFKNESLINEYFRL